VFVREVGQNMKIEVTEVVEFVEKYVQCNDCRKKFTPHDWVALVQVRQQVSHKKTILNLEQVLLKQKLLDRIIKTE
jgi:nonsense-mediated mRNA decay protein 3